MSNPLANIGARMQGKLGPLRVWQWAAVGGVGVGALLLFRQGAGGAGGAGGYAATPPSDAPYVPFDPYMFNQTYTPLTPQIDSAPIIPGIDSVTPSAFRISSPQLIPTPAAPTPGGGPVGFQTNVVTLHEGVNQPAAPIIPGVDWSPAAVAGFFSGPGDVTQKFGLSTTPASVPAPTFHRTESGFTFDIAPGVTGAVAPTQRLIGYSGNTPIFQ